MITDFMPKKRKLQVTKKQFRKAQTEYKKFMRKMEKMDKDYKKLYDKHEIIRKKYVYRLRKGTKLVKPSKYPSD